MYVDSEPNSFEEFRHEFVGQRKPLLSWFACTKKHAILALTDEDILKI